MRLRFVDGRPVSAVTGAFLAWATERLAAAGVRVLALVWDNASWHISREARTWIKRHNRRVKAAGAGCLATHHFLRVWSRSAIEAAPFGASEDLSGRWDCDDRGGDR